ncbi:hypothetical protein [Gelidibacter gilvus]|uniref:Uncharacterized protein n=1 Tax=Gelidibacter gilvus TaxID=59602 RepID=A0A4Q0XG64_9FLAO|nr:hypothetical protein [Gelidibacter gilvus]RXJ50230.1 hypothetical protein ESZ48_09630 [Gelidibacter gilvus]
MARQTGPFKISGTLGEINFFITKGVGYSRKAGGGFNGFAIRTQDNMKRVRENASEFGHCSRVKKQFRLALLPFLNPRQNKTFHSRMMQVFLQIKALDAVSERGKRRVNSGLQTEKGQQVLRQYEVTPKNPVLYALYKTTAFDWPSQTLRITNFNPAGLKGIKTATHLGVTMGILDFDFDSLESTLAVSPTRFLEVGAGPSSFELVPDLLRPPAHTGIVLLGIRYYEIIANEVYGLETLRGLQILEVHGL